MAPRICEVGGSGLFFPLKGDEEQEGDKTVRGICYLVGLGYMFMGVNIIADYFMAAVENIVSVKIRVKDKTLNRTFTELRWNDTVANLSLLALGSSAPEILLSCVEMVGNKFHSGALGPSTIVGSAAFNLLVIIGVCVYYIPSGEIRAIKEMPAYHVTVIFSIFAYLWLLAIVQWITPNVIDIWEAVVTLVMFPTLVFVSFKADQGAMDFMALENVGEEEEQLTSAVSPDGTTSTQSAGMRNSLSLATASHKHDGGFHKHNLGPPKAQKAHEHRIHHIHHKAGDQVHISAAKSVGADPPAAGEENGEIFNPTTNTLIKCDAGVLTFLKDEIEVNGTGEETSMDVKIARKNGTAGKVSCRIRTEGLDAVANYDFEDIDEKLVFLPGQTEKIVSIKIFPKRPGEPDDMFQVILEDAKGDAQFNPNDDGGEEHGVLTVKILNKNPEEAKTFADRLGKCLNMDLFRAGLDIWKDQIADSFKPDEESDDEDEDDAEEKDEKGEDQKEGEDKKEEDKPDDKCNPVDWFFHILSFPWKFIFAVMSPPPVWAGGWILFTLSLLYIAVLIAIVWDLASLFGCCVGMSDEVTAITVVALGTSLPDMLASQTSAMQDETADASIVNVTGSNSVNVFLGIGIPWSICAIYWAIVGDTTEWRDGAAILGLDQDEYAGKFVVQAGTLGFSVLVFSCVAIMALTLLRHRRLTYGGELGGPTTPKTVSACVLFSLWLIYIGLSIARSASDSLEVLQWPLVGLACICAIAGAFREYQLRKSGLVEKPQIKPADSEKSTGAAGKSPAGSPAPKQIGNPNEGDEESPAKAAAAVDPAAAPAASPAAAPATSPAVAGNDDPKKVASNGVLRKSGGTKKDAKKPVDSRKQE